MNSEDLIVGACVEYASAIEKFPIWPTDPLHALAILGEEFGELTKAVVQAIYEPEKNKRYAVHKEAVQTAAMALRFLANLEKYKYLPSAQSAAQSQSQAGE